jgi:hypothetical protein
MKSIGYVVTAVVLAVLGAVVLAFALIERRIASAEEMLASLDLVKAGAAYDRLEKDLGSARYVPWLSGDEVDRIRVRRAAVRYWNGDYDNVLVIRDANAGQRADPELLFIAANSIFRAGQRVASDAQDRLRTIDEARSAYQAVLSASAGHPDAAFNYEYLAVLRDELTRSRLPRAPAAGNTARLPDPLPDPRTRTLHGREGAPPPPQSGDKFNIHVPEEPDERGKGKEPGTEQLLRRKG